MQNDSKELASYIGVTENVSTPIFKFLQAFHGYLHCVKPAHKFYVQKFSIFPSGLKISQIQSSDTFIIGKIEILMEFFRVKFFLHLSCKYEFLKSSHITNNQITN